MRVSVELFLLDNLLMDYLILRLAAVFACVRLKTLPALGTAAAGALYALLATACAPLLNTLVPKLALGCVMALPLGRGWRAYGRGLACLYLSAFLTGGLAFALTMLFGGESSGGVLYGTVRLRTVLLAAAGAASLPRIVRTLLTLYQSRTRYVTLRIVCEDREMELTALVDSGNLLTEPISGLPVVVVRPGLLPEGKRPVPYRTIAGDGMLYAMRPKRIAVWTGGAWTELDAMIASAPAPIAGADAVLDGALWMQKGREHDAEQMAGTTSEVVLPPVEAAGKARVLHPLGRNASAAVSERGGAELDRAAGGRGAGGQERPH